MLYRSRPKKVFYYGKPVDFRKQALGLAAIVDLELPGEIEQGHWFVFASCDKRKIRILYWRGTGLALWQLRLEGNVFKLGRPRVVEPRTLSWRDLGRLLDGFNIFDGPPHAVTKAKRFS